MEFNGLKTLVVGSGFWGAVMAERIATVLNQKVVVLEKRNHIGGNCFSKIHAESGIEVHQYGTHIFHTSSEAVWSYIRRFTEFTPYQHKVFTKHKNRVYTMPINLGTINAFYGLDLSPSEAEVFISEEARKSGISEPKNLEEKAISLIGRPLYEAFIRGYTAKQWEKDPKDLPSDIITRLPVRKNLDNNYFNDPYQGMPREGYSRIFERLLKHDNIEVHTGVDYFDLRDKIPPTCTVIYTGPIDQLFRYHLGALEWRSIRLEEYVHPVGDFQGTSVMNYADRDIPYTRIHEFKHLHPERTVSSALTVTHLEYSKSYSPKTHETEDPYYPINTQANNRLLESYQEEAKKIPNLVLGGRLGKYAYFDMDKAIADALQCFKTRIAKKKRP